MDTIMDTGTQIAVEEGETSVRPLASYSPRIGRMREDLLGALYEADIERARYYTKSYQQTEGEAPCMRAAKGLLETLRHMSIKIDTDECLVGAKTIKKVSGPMGIERTFQDRTVQLAVPFHGKKIEDIAFLDDYATGGPRWLQKLLEMPESEVKEITEEIIPYWTGKNMNSIMLDRWAEAGYPAPPNYLFNSVALIADMQGHVLIGLQKILTMGFKGISEQAARQLAEFTRDDEKYEWRKDFLESIRVSSQAVCEFAERYAKLAEKTAEKTNEPRRSELLKIAARCRRVPAQPPTNFMEALQAIWMSQVALQISYGEDSIFSPGRVDQYLFPFYKKDKEMGLMGPDDALEAISEYYIKLGTFTGFGPNHVTIGGVDRDGESAVNELSYLMIKAYDNLKGLRNSLAVRTCPEKTPRDFLLQACEVHRKTAGLSFYNDEVVIRGLMADGYALEDARDYGAIGCAELAGTGNSNGYASGSSCHFEHVLEMTLHEGKRFSTGWQQVGVKTSPASEFKTFEDVKKAFETQLANAVEAMVSLSNIKDQVFAESFPAPLLSSTIEGCVESGLDVTRGGARYNHSTVSAQGIGTVANSLAAIKWAVFDYKLVTMEEMVKHLRNNFEGAEELRLILARKAPKYGNNDPRADDITVWALNLLDREARKYKRPMDGGTYRALMISAGTQVIAGRHLGATPDGRKQGEAVSNGISPVNGTEQEGMTATLHSVAKACQPELSGGTALNMTINPAIIRTEEGLEKFASLIEGYFELGGRQVQFNPVSRQMLQDAQKNHDKYPDLMVRVSGYSYRFIDLSRALQDDIIARTEFSI